MIVSGIILPLVWKNPIKINYILPPYLYFVVGVPPGAPTFTDHVAHEDVRHAQVLPGCQAPAWQPIPRL